MSKNMHSLPRSGETRIKWERDQNYEVTIFLLASISRAF
jgi:hypothetical protein